MRRRRYGVNGGRFGRRDADLSVAIKNGRESLYKYIGRDFFDLHPFERFGWQYGLPGNYQLCWQRLRGSNLFDGDGCGSSADCHYHPAGRF